MAGASTTYTTARFLTPDYIVRGQDNALSCPLWRAGALVAPTAQGSTVTVYDAGNVAVYTSGVTLAGSIATVTIPASSLPTSLALGMGWRVEWALLVGTATTTYRNSAGLVRSQLAPVVTDADLFRRESALNPNPAGGAPISSLTTFQDYLDEAWVTIHARLTGKGNLPHLIMEPSVLREPHLYLTLHLIFQDFRTRLNETWKQKAEDYLSRFDKSWDGLAFEYSVADTGQSDGRRKRSVNPTCWLGGFD